MVTGRQYQPCTHRVAAAPGARYSIVFHLRMRRDALLDSARLRHPPHLPRLRLTVADFVAQQTVRRPSRNQPVVDCKHGGERSASKIGDNCGTGAAGGTGQEQEPVHASQSMDSRRKEFLERAKSLSGEPEARTVCQPVVRPAMIAAVKRSQAQNMSASI